MPYFAPFLLFFFFSCSFAFQRDPFLPPCIATYTEVVPSRVMGSTRLQQGSLLRYWLDTRFSVRLDVPADDLTIDIVYISFFFFFSFLFFNIFFMNFT